jgi:biotin synthase
MEKNALRDLHAAAAAGTPVNAETALAILASAVDELPEVMAAASAVRARYFGRRVQLCSILNARSGACPEDCVFCAQSAHHHTAVPAYDLLASEEILRARREAASLPIDRYGIVTSGPAVGDADLERICATVRAPTPSPATWCASLGALGAGGLRRLREAGVRRFHHNLETAESHFPRICTTHAYADRIATVRAAKEAGLEVCSGGILGLGETAAQRVELALALAREDVDAIPLNFLIPVPGTRMADASPLSPLDILRSIAMFRLTNPAAEIKVCAGRVHLRDLQSQIFLAGASGMMIGPLLTVAGRDVEQDLRMLRDLEMEFGP